MMSCRYNSTLVEETFKEPDGGLLSGNATHKLVARTSKFVHSPQTIAKDMVKVHEISD